MKISRIILMMYVANTVWLVGAADNLKHEVIVESFFCCEKLEKIVCVRCCGSSTLASDKEGNKQLVLHHYSCCDVDKAIQLVQEESNKIVAKNSKIMSLCKVKRRFDLPAMYCCIRQASMTIVGLPRIEFHGSKPAAVDAKRD